MSDFNFIDTDTDKLYDSIISQVMQEVREPLYPGDERRIYSEAVVMLFAVLYSNFNDKAKQRFIRFARGNILDAIGEFLNVVRAEPAKAYATFKFEVEATRPENIVIPEGTRITTDGTLYFATDISVVLSAGEMSVNVKASCTEGGSDYNGIVPEQISTLVDLIPYISKVTNITTTTGGDDGEPYTDEGDSRFRQRIQLAPAQITTAGPESSYIYYAMSADADIIDVALDSPSANIVNIYPLMKGGQLPDEDTLRAVETACSADDVRPMTDKVTAIAPITEEYSVHVHYYCTIENEAETIAAMEGANGAIERYNEWQQGALKRDINPDYLRKLMLVPGDGLVGAERVDITSPTYKAVDAKAVPRLKGPVTVTHEVI